MISTPDFGEFASRFPNVSRETYDKLCFYLACLAAYNAHTNLVAPASLDQAWERHVYDSLQLLPFLEGETYLDIGAGAGFPGLVLAIAGKRGFLVESIFKKAIFLENVSRETFSSASVINARVEDISFNAPGLGGDGVPQVQSYFRDPVSGEQLSLFSNLNVSRETFPCHDSVEGFSLCQTVKPTLPKQDHVTARAVAPLTKLIAYAIDILKPDGSCVFLKGKKTHEEIAEAKKKWRFDYTLHSSQTSPDGQIIIIKKIKKLHENNRSSQSKRRGG